MMEGIRIRLNSVGLRRVFFAFVGAFVVASVPAGEVGPSRKIQNVDFPGCPIEHYSPPDPKTDGVAKLLEKRYRLVIGVNEFSNSKQAKLSFVEPTARLVNNTLKSLHYDSLPGRTDDSLLIGSGATKAAVMDAVRDMVLATQSGGGGIIYWIGHGNTSSTDHPDLALAVYDEPVGPDHGIMFTSVYKQITTGTFRQRLQAIPKVLFVLDTCESGVLAAPPLLVNDQGSQRLLSNDAVILPPQVGILTAVSEANESFQLLGTEYSAFGYFLSRGLSESGDWACADINSADGIMTLHELRYFLKSNLDFAAKMGMIEGPMNPQKQGSDGLFVAYSPSHRANDGDRAELLDLSLTPPPAGKTLTISFDDGERLSCSANDICKFPISRKSISLGSKVVLTASTKVRSKGIASSGGDGLAKTDSIARVTQLGSVSLQDLLRKRSITVSGTTISIR